MLMDAHHRRVDHLHRGIMCGGQCAHDACPDPCPPPPNEPIVAGRTRNFFYVQSRTPKEIEEIIAIARQTTSDDIFALREDRGDPMSKSGFGDPNSICGEHRVSCGNRSANSPVRELRKCGPKIISTSHLRYSQG
jgi:hypothetical protein